MRSLAIAFRDAALSFSFLTLLAPAAGAQEPWEEAADFGDLDALEISGETPAEMRSNQITAFRTGTLRVDVPQSVTVFTREQIEKQGVDSIGDIIDYTPGVVNSQGEGHRDSVVFRGVRTTADFFVDGVRDDVEYFRPLYNVEQVEILRGPNALFFGRGGTGGVLNRVLKKAEVGGDFGEIQGSVNSFGSYHSQFDFNKSIGERAAFRLNLFYESLDNHRDLFDGERLGVNPALTFSLGEDTTLHLSYEYNDHERFIDRGIPVGANGRPADFLAGTTFGDAALNETTLEAHSVRAAIKHRFSDSWSGSLSGFYGTYEKVYQNYFPSDYNQSTNEVEIDGYVDRTDRQNFTLSGDVLGEFATGFLGHKVILGGEYIHTSSDQNRFNNVWSTNGEDQEFFSAANFRMRDGRVRNSSAVGRLSDLNDDTRSTIDAFSVFLQDEVAITEKLDLVLGARFDSFDIEVTDAVSGEARSRRDQEVSPRVGVVLKPLENLSLYASYSETFLPRSGEQFANINPPADALAPDTFSNLEAGVKWDIFDDLSFTLSAFQIEASSPQASDADPDTLDVIDTETVGFETQIRGRITDWWEINAGYSYLDGEQIDRSGDTGLRPREQPEHTFSVWNNFAITDNFGVGVGLIYQDDSFADNSNTATLPNYVRVDAAVYYTVSDSLRVQLNVENLLDEEYFPSAHTAHNITVGAPISAALKIPKTF